MPLVSRGEGVHKEGQEGPDRDSESPNRGTCCQVMCLCIPPRPTQLAVQAGGGGQLGGR